MRCRVWVPVLLLGVVSVASQAGAQVSRVTPAGETRTAARLGSHMVEVVITTHKAGRIPIPNSSCTGGRGICWGICSPVDSLSIKVDGKPLEIPRSLFCDLADLNTARLSLRGGRFILHLTLGDASASYEATTEFDAGRVISRSLASGLDPDHPLVKTTYSPFRSDLFE